MENENFQEELGRLWDAVEAVMAEQRQLWDALAAARLDDNAVGEMAKRYNDKMAVIKGGF